MVKSLFHEREMVEGKVGTILTHATLHTCLGFTFQQCLWLLVPCDWGALGILSQYTMVIMQQNTGHMCLVRCCKLFINISGAAWQNCCSCWQNNGQKMVSPV